MRQNKKIMNNESLTPAFAYDKHISAVYWILYIKQ